jgi:hypothetical protein
MKALIACEFSGIVRTAFEKRGWDAISCDLLPTEIPGNHYQGDVMDIINDGFDLMIAHPPCTFLTVTANKWHKPEYKTRFPNREQNRLDAIEFFMKLINCKIPKYAIENPVGIMSTLYQKPTQIIQPFQFGEPHSKRTCLWLKGLPKLQPVKIVEPEFYIYKDGRKDPSWHVQSMRLPPLERMKYRSKTLQGIAEAMAEQWTNYILEVTK